MGTVISNLKAKFGVDTSDFKKGLKDGEKSISDFKQTAGKSFDDLADTFGMDTSKINSSLNTLTKEMNFFRQSIIAAAEGGNKFTIAMKALKVALMSTGIGALVVALGSLVTYFKETGEGADKLSVILAKMRSVVDNIVDRVQTVGKGLVEIFSGNVRSGIQTIKNSMKGLGDEIKRDWQEAGQLAQEMNAIDKRELELVTIQQQRSTKIAELREKMRDLEYTEQQRLAFAQEAERITKEYYADEIALAQQRYEVTKRQLEISASDPTRDQLREVAELEAQVLRAQEEQANSLRALSRERNTLVKAVEAQVAEEKALIARYEELQSLPTIEPIKLNAPELQQGLSTTLMEMQKFTEEVESMTIDLGQTINEAFEDMAGGLGEFFGELMAGDAKMSGFASTMAQSFGDLAVTVGKLLIASGTGIEALSAALKVPENAPLAIAAGVALVALGTAVKSSLANIATSGSTVSGGGVTGASYDVRDLNYEQATTQIEITGELTAKGSDLVYVLNNEDQRKKITT
ncbi:MAG: hypothetical protein J6X92_02705 [Bacteroidales bacterium]|nr:hypothetical protein [Bacteroidales bacterium]